MTSASKPAFADLFLFRSGRLGRRAFALRTLACLTLELAIVAWIFVPAYLAQERYMEMAAAGQPLPNPASVSALSLVLGVVIGVSRLVLLVMAIVCLWSGVAQRAHDLGWSGWASLWLLIPFVNLYFLFVFFTRQGDAVPNRFG